MFNTKIYDTMDSSSIELLWEGEALFENNLKCNSGPALFQALMLLLWAIISILVSIMIKKTLNFITFYDRSEIYLKYAFQLRTNKW